MTKNELFKLLNGHEWNEVEFKRAQRGVPDAAYETVSSFSNASGGWLVFGIVDNGGQHEIAGVLDVDKVQNDFLSALRADNKVNHDIQVESKLIDVDGKIVLAFRIPEASRQNKPIYLNRDIRRSFVRRGGCDHRCTMHEIERFLRDASEQRWDGQVFDFPLEKAFDRESIKWYRSLFNNSNPGHDESLSDQDFLYQWGHLIYKEQKLYPTRASIILFGTPAAIRQILPRPTLDVQWIPSSLGDPLPEIRWLDRVVFEDNLIITWRGLVSRYMQKVEKPFRIDPHTLLRNDAPPEYRVFREAAINLLIHQDYANHGFKAVIKFYRDVIQFWNPGDVFGNVDQLMEPGEKEVRNPQIVAAFRRLGLCEQAGTGIRMVVYQWQALGHPQPEYENDRSRNVFEIRLPLAKGHVTHRLTGEVAGEVTRGVTGEVAGEVRHLLTVISGEMSRRRLQAAMKLKSEENFRQRYLSPALDAGFIELTIPGKPKSRNQEYRLTEKGRHLLEIGKEEEKGNRGQYREQAKSTTGEVTREVTVEVAGEVRQLLTVISGEMSRRRLQAAMKLKSEENFRQRYLAPALDAGFIEMTNPGKPRSSNQEYRLTEKGRQLLEIG
jgi:ATP-dependent DNA helicase RecG